MSDAQPPPVPDPTPDSAPALSTDSLWTPQAVVGLALVVILAGTVVAAFAYGTAEMRSQTVGGVVALSGAVVQYYFGSSRGGQAKDERADAKQSPPPAIRS